MIEDKLNNDFCRNRGCNPNSGGNESDPDAGVCYGCDDLEKYENSWWYSFRVWFHYFIEEIKQKLEA